MRRGYSIIELLVAIFIVSLILAAAYNTYTALHKKFRRTASTAETQIESEIALSILQKDIKHAGYGISTDEPNLPLDWDSSEETLIIRSAFNPTRDFTYRWVIVSCNSGGCTATINPYGININSYNLVYINVYTKKFEIYGNADSLGTGVFLGLDVPTDANGCASQKCFLITYSLTQSPAPNCNPNTKNLKRAVGDSTGVSIISCVADWVVTFDADVNDDGTVGIDERDLTTLDFDSSGIVDRTDLGKLRSVNVYVLYHEGEKDREYNFSGYENCSGQACIKAGYNGSVELLLPSDFQHYRWRVVTLSVDPVNVRGSGG